MKPRKNEKYNYGWSDPRSYTQTIKYPTEPTHTRTLYFELDTSKSTFSQVIVHNDKIHGAKDAFTDSERV
jgi:hypothetical protein